MDLIVFLTYAGGTFTFIAVLVCGELMFSSRYVRREKFRLRFLLGNAAVLVFSILLTLLYYYIETAFDSYLISSLRVIVTYIIFFAACVLVMCFSYKENLLRCLTASALGYICQHICYNIYSAIDVSFKLEYNIIVSLGMWAYILCMLIQLAVGAAVFVIIWFALGRKLERLSTEGIAQVNMAFIVISSLIIVLVLSSMGFAFGSDNVGVSLMFKGLLIICCVFMLILYANIFKATEVRAERDVLLRLNENEHTHFLKLKQDMELIGIKCHDIKHFISSAGAREGIDLGGLSDVVRIYDTTIKTGNEVIDTMLAERSLYCNAHGITVTAIADASALDFITVTDMCSLFGNMLENAIEATEKIEERERRLININIRPVAGQVFLCMENSYDGDTFFNDGAIATTKKYGQGYHGFGIKSIKLIAEKYGGNLSFGGKDGIFRVSILFPIPQKTI